MGAADTDMAKKIYSVIVKQIISVTLQIFNYINIHWLTYIYVCNTLYQAMYLYS